MDEQSPAKPADLQSSVFQSHSRLFANNRFVYPVVSRRSHGVSVGINLNPDKVCNFDCIYCQVDRRSTSETRFVEMNQLLTELESVLQLVTTEKIFDHPTFSQTPTDFRRLNDIAFSGDGEPTTFRNFDSIVESVAEVRTRFCDATTRMVLITNASMFHREHMAAALSILDQNNGQIWAKLDAGTAEYYQLIERTSIPFRRVLDNITIAAQIRPIVIQSLFMNVRGVPPADTEIYAFADRLAEIVAVGGKLSLVQIYTVARQPAESFVTALPESFLRRISEIVESKTGLQTAVYH